MSDSPSTLNVWSFRLPLLLTCLFVVLAGIVAQTGSPALTAFAVAAAFLPYSLLLRREWEPQISLRGSLLLVSLAGVALALAPPVLSDDVYRFLWEGRVTLSGTDPYAFTPDDPALFPLRDAAWRKINHATIATIYPPLTQVWFAAGALLSSVFAFKFLALALHLVATATLQKDFGTRAALLFGLNPLALTESALSGHVDVAVGLSLLMLAVALRKQRHARAAGFLLLAAGTKLVGLLFLPLLWPSKKSLLIASALCLLIVLPVATAGYASETPSGFSHYSQRWEGNAGPFHLVRETFEAGLSVLSPITGAEAESITLGFLRPVLLRLDGTSYDPRAVLLSKKKLEGDVATFQVSYLASMASKGFLAISLFGLILWLRRKHSPLVVVRWAVLLLLLFAPQVHPWYLLWLLPVEIAAGRKVAIVWSAAVLIAYAPLSGWVTHAEWAVPWGASWVQYGVVVAALVLEWVGRPPQGQPE